MARGPSIGRRRGISLLEVLISIGVVAIGLLSVASLIPVAYHQALQGTLNDRAAWVGRRAFREFRVRGMDRPSTWYAAQTGQLFDTSGNLWRYAWVIDPRGYAAYTGLTGTTGVNPNAFPAVGALGPMTFPPGNRLQRVTLRAAAPINNLGTPIPSALTPMTLPQADQIFICHDDLSVEIPDQDGAPPQQELWTFDGTNTAVVSLPSPAAVKRYAEGHFSWMATLVPEPKGDDYLLSVVVFYQRVLDPLREYFGQVHIRSFPPRQLAVSAGEMMVDVPNVAAVHEAIRPEGWVLLTQPQPVPGGSLELRARWYRIVMTDGDADDAAQSTGPIVTRSLTVDGPDWESPPNSKHPVMAVFLPEVRNVYQKTIHLDSSSMWPD